MQTLIDPFEVASTYVPPPARAPMATLSIDVEVEDGLFSGDAVVAYRSTYSSDPESVKDSWTRVRCWCSED